MASTNPLEIADEILVAVSEGPIKLAAVRAVRKRASKQIEDLAPSAILQLARELMQRAPYGRFLACELVQHHPSTMETIKVSEVEALGAGMNNWAEVDTFSIYIAGPAWRIGRISDAVLTRWAQSPDHWWRRAAVVSTVPLNSAAQGGRGDAPRTLAICGLLISDRHDMVVKAMSWALRALAKPAPEEAHKFLADHRQELAPRIIREVSNKLSTGLKNPKGTRGAKATAQSIRASYSL